MSYLLVIDFEILSTFCGFCEQKLKLVNKEGEEYKPWLESHKTAVECEVYLTGFSAAMEVTAAAALMWQRSIKLCNMKYTMISDVHARTYNHLQELGVGIWSNRNCKRCFAPVQNVIQ